MDAEDTNEDSAALAPKTLRAFVLSIFFGLSIAVLSVVILLRINTFHTWIFDSLHYSLRLEQTVVFTKTRDRLSITNLQTLKESVRRAAKPSNDCFFRIYGVERVVASLMALDGVFDICAKGVAAGERLNTTVQRFVDAQITPEEAEALIRADARALQRYAGQTSPYLDRYTSVTTVFLLFGLAVSVLSTTTLVHRQYHIIRQQIANAWRLSTRLKSAIDSIDDGFAIYDHEDRLVGYNDAYASLTVFDPKSLYKGAFRKNILQVSIDQGFYADGDDGPVDSSFADSLVQTANSQTGAALKLSDGRHVLVRFRETQTGDRVIVRTDNTAVMQAAANEARRARTDVLTDLPNRRAFDEACDAVPVPFEGERILIRADLDNFKTVNDTLGHEAGDHVLVSFSDMMQGAVKKGDFVARLSGDEFAILLSPRADMQRAHDIIAAVDHAMQTPVRFQGAVCRFGVSWGVASTALGAQDMTDLLSFADTALYEAKRKGRGRTDVFSSEMKGETLRRRQLAADIRGALETGQIVPFLQPQVDAATFNILGFEVLARWQHPELGRLAPSDFLPVATQLRLERQVDAAVFNAVTRAAADMDAAVRHSLGFSFNVSTDRLRDPELVTQARRLVDLGVRTTFEVLESVLVEDERMMSELCLDALRDAGVLIEIDDFGSGHASILGVRALHPDGIKIDRRIVQPILDDPHSREIVDAIVAIARTMNLSIVAEGVESFEHARLLRQHGVGILQGYAFAKALPLREAMLLLDRSPGIWTSQVTA